MKINNIVEYFKNLSFFYKTSILIVIITLGMITIIVLSQISLYVLKGDFDILFDKRTKTIMQLINIKDTYKINIYDTLEEFHVSSINDIQAREVILLGQELINKNWKEYKKITINNPNKSNFFIEYIKSSFYFEESNKIILKNNIIKNIDKKLLKINTEVEQIIKVLKNNSKLENDILIKNIYLKINYIDISLTNLTNYDMNIAIDEKRITQKVFKIITTVLNISIVIIFIISIFLSIIVLKYFNKLHFDLENNVIEKTKELQEINEHLEFKIKTEVENSRKKDMVIYQQAKLASLGEMLHNIAHQWRQPLGSILMIIQTFQSKMELGKLTPEIVKEKVEDAIYLTTNMSNTLDDFQNFFDPTKDKITFSISKCINHTLELSKYLLENENINVQLEIKDDLKLNSFYNELSHVLLNIISNSKDALLDKTHKKHINIIVERSNNNLKINIFDNGGGIDEKILPLIFDPYYTTKYKSAGTGIGLYMSKQIIEKHMNGFLKCKNTYYKIDSKEFENCTVFTILIPV